uniref:Uncharacterized protein n=1 Tax=viral metagenome TaxID=1070528 RepID=A0A6C0HWA5_9ZZZZ
MSISVWKTLHIMEAINKTIETYIVEFKTELQQKINILELITPQSTELERTKIRELMEYIYEYPKLSLSKKDIATNSSASSVQSHLLCIAKRSDGIQCTRKKKKNCEYCGTHAKLENANHEKSLVPQTKKMEISTEEINGIIYYIDEYDNVYHTEDILEGKENPRIIAKAKKNVDNSYLIPDFS